MTSRLAIITFVLTLVLNPRALHAQEDFRFQPPRPPPLDVDFDDEDDDEMGDEFARVPVAPAVISPGANNKADPVPPPGGAPPGGGGAGAGGGNFGSSVSAGKFRFKVVEGEYWEKGKKRTRGKETHVSGSEGSRGGAGLR